MSKRKLSSIALSVVAALVVALSIPCAAQEKSPSIKYDARLGMLVFRDAETFRATVDRLHERVTTFEYDKGNTAEFLAALAPNHSKRQADGDSRRAADATATTLYSRLQASYPLSEEVLIAILTSNLPVASQVKLLETNIDFGEEVASVLQSAKLPSSFTREISRKRFKRVPFQPVLDEFETLFPGFISLRRTTDAAELRFLLSGGNPADPANPADRNSLSRALSTLLNAKTEVKIGSAIHLYLVGREITISNGDQSILGYIRTHGDVPRRKVPASEPENGLLSMAAPWPIDPNIVVNPTARENGCGEVVIGSDEPVSGRLSFHANVKGDGLTYYWEFGDGYVSYKENPTHAYIDSTVHSVNLAVFNELGMRCGSTSGPQAGSGTGSGAGTNCTLPAVLVVQGGSNLTITSAIYATGIFSPPLSVQWNFGDGGFSVSSPTNHIYQVAGTYPLTVIATDNAGCVYTNQTSVTVSGPVHTSACCTKYDKSKTGTLSTGGNHMFKHTLKTNNSWGITPEVYANVTTYTKTAGIWFWSYNTSGVNVAGKVFGNDPDTNSCDAGFVVSKVQTGKYFFNTIRIPISRKPIYTEYQSVTSDGSAFGDNDHIAISDCQ